MSYSLFFLSTLDMLEQFITSAMLKSKWMTDHDDDSDEMIKVRLKNKYFPCLLNFKICSFIALPIDYLKGLLNFLFSF